MAQDGDDMTWPRIVMMERGPGWWCYGMAQDGGVNIWPRIVVMGRGSGLW